MSSRKRKSILWTGWAAALVIAAPCLIAQTSAMEPAATNPPPSAASSEQPAKNPPSVAPIDLPDLRPGQWEYRRTILTAADPKPQKSSVKRCGNPSAEIKQKVSELRQKGCQFSPLTHRGSQYFSSWTCPSSGGLLADRNVLTILSNTSYRDENEVRLGEHVTRSTLVANRLGDCPLPEDKSKSASTP